MQSRTTHTGLTTATGSLTVAAIRQAHTARVLRPQQHSGGPARATSWIGALLVPLLLGGAAPAAAELAYVGSSTIGDHLIPAAAEAFARKTGVKLASIAIQGSGHGLELVVRGAAPLAGVSRPLTFVEKQQRIYYQTIGYDAAAVYVHASNPRVEPRQGGLKGIYTGRIRSWKEVRGTDSLIVVITQIPGSGRRSWWSSATRSWIVAYREGRREVDRQPDQVTALLSEPGDHGGDLAWRGRPSGRWPSRALPPTLAACAPVPTSCPVP